MLTETLILVTKQARHRVTIKNYEFVDETDITVLLNKTATDVWRWARFHRAKVYFEEFQPQRNTHDISHAKGLHRGCQL
jgi:hypothetical protein